MTLYWSLKYVHVGAVVASASLFLLRGAWMLASPSLLQRRWVRVVPHVVDSVLLAAALGLIWLTGQYPFAQPWLTAKVLALVAYIVLGSIALRRGRTPWVRAAAFVAAVSMFAYIVGVALTRSPSLGF
ncbi:MAG TPA: SirB2 family protein [Burkholderiales bacterium]|jgi:uncharacterized membrane protein SirB2|nr:SirB2 family protein [Burkholderiales bacterium]